MPLFSAHTCCVSPSPPLRPQGPSAPCRSSTARQDKAATPLPRGGHPGPNVDIVDIGGGCVKDQLAGLARQRPGCAHAVFGHCSGLAAAATGAPWPAISKKRVRPAVLAPTACWLLALGRRNGLCARCSNTPPAREGQRAARRAELTAAPPRPSASGQRLPCPSYFRRQGPACR